MYSNKYPGPSPVPPLLDNNLAINTAQGREGARPLPPQVSPGAPAEAPPHLDLQQPRLPWQIAGTPPPPVFSPRQGRKGLINSAWPTLSAGRAAGRDTEQPLSCRPQMPGEGFLYPLLLG